MKSTAPMRPSGSDSTGNILGSRLSPRAKLLRKLLAPAVSAYLASARMAYRLKRPWAGKLLRRIGWRDADIDQNAAEHLSITFSGGPRLDLFVYPQGSPVRSAPMHPHIALTVSPGRFLEWKRRLESRGVVVAGPTRPGLPGQASFYFNDPFGNHLELVTLGFIAFDLPVGVPDRSRLDYRWSRESAAA